MKTLTNVKNRLLSERLEQDLKLALYAAYKAGTALFAMLGTYQLLNVLELI